MAVRLGRRLRRRHDACRTFHHTKHQLFDEFRRTEARYGPRLALFAFRLLPFDRTRLLRTFHSIAVVITTLRDTLLEFGTRQCVRRFMFCHRIRDFARTLKQPNASRTAHRSQHRTQSKRSQTNMRPHSTHAPDGQTVHASHVSAQLPSDPQPDPSLASAHPTAGIQPRPSVSIEHERKHEPRKRPKNRGTQHASRPVHLRTTLRPQHRTPLWKLRIFPLKYRRFLKHALRA